MSSSLNPLQFVIFDCDGVLIDSEVLANQVEVDIKTELGFPISLEDQCVKFTGMGKSHPELQKEFTRLPADFRQQVDDRVLEVYKKELKAIKGTKETLQTLQMPKCVASSSEADWLDLKLQLTGLKDFFPNAIFHGDLVERCKPEPDLFLFALKSMGWAAEKTLVIEDSVHGVRAGRAAGLTVCGFLGGAHIYPGHGERLRAAGADFLISDLREMQTVIDQLNARPLRP